MTILPFSRARRWLPLLLLPLLGGHGACAPAEETADFRFLNIEPESIDPGQLSDQAGGRIALNLFEGLTTRDPQTLAPRPGMATRWELEDDGRRWIFHLRTAQWSDGEPVRAGDFLFAWRRLLHPATGARYANLLFPVVGAREFNATGEGTLGLSAPDDSTFVVELVDPLPYFLDLCAFYPLLPVPPHVLKEYGDRWTRRESIVTNGAWTLEEWQLNRRIRLRKNPLYHGADRVAFERVDALPGDYINGNFNRYESGLLDWIDSSGVPLAIVDLLREREDWHDAPFLGTYFYRFNTTRPPLDDPRVRKALYLAADAQPICEHVLGGGQVPATSLVPPGLPGYTPIELEGHNPQRARDLLAEAGFPGGEGFPSLILLFNSSEAHRQVAEVLQQQWKETLDIDIRLENQEWKVFMSTVAELDYDIARGGWIGDYLDPSTFLDCWLSGSGNNRTGWKSESYDALIASSQAELEPARRMELLHEAERQVMEESMVVLPIYRYVVTNLFDASKWEGLQPNLVNHLDLKSIRPRASAQASIR